MKKEILFVSALLVIIVLSGCVEPPANNGGLAGNGSTTSVIPPECVESSGDVCSLFSCMVDLCWCADPDPVLLEGTSPITSEEEAVALVQNFVQTSGSEYTRVERATNLSSQNVFFNVFAYNKAGDETVFTVASDGSIIKTQCGV